MDTKTAYLKVNEKIKSSKQLNNCMILIRGGHEETYIHSLHVAILMMLLCKELSLSEEKTDVLVKSALLHDIGKLFMDKGILDKRGSLTQEERKEIERHPKKGYKVAKAYGFSKDILRRILLHHVKPKREGYPKVCIVDKDLINDLELLQMCDVYSAIVMPRSYHIPYPSTYALKEISRESIDVRNLVAFKKIATDNIDNDTFMTFDK